MPRFSRRWARLLLPILVMTAACRDEAQILDPTTGAGRSARSALLAPPVAGGYQVRAAPTSLELVRGPTVASLCQGGCPTDSSVVDFELFTDPTAYHQLTTQYDSLGVHFDSVVVAVVPGYYYQNYPPRSGAAAATADFTPLGGGSGIFYFSFPTAAAVGVRLFVTSLGPMTLRCFNAGGMVLDSTYFAGGNTVETQGGIPNQPVELSAPGIRRCEFAGGDNQYGVDDLTVFWNLAVPTLSCNSVIRGQTGTCTVAGADSVLRWRFDGVLDSASRMAFGDSLVADSSLVPDTTWSGTAVLSGIVSALVRYGPGPDTLTLVAPWDVQPRTGSQWRWGHTNWILDHWEGRLCQYPDLVLKLVGGVWKFTGVNAGRLAVNRRKSGCNPGSIEPNLFLFPDSGTTVATGIGGPNAGLHYVAANTFRIHRATEINDWLDSLVSPVATIVDSINYNYCWTRMNPPPPYGTTIQRSLFTFNRTCADTGMTTIVQRIWAHEEYGTQDSSSLITANGHESRRRLAAKEIANDPRALVEPLVSKTTVADLKFVLGLRVWAADQRITLIAGDHWKVNNNVIDSLTGNCLGAWFRRLPAAPTPWYYNDHPLSTVMPDSVTPGCP